MQTTEQYKEEKKVTIQRQQFCISPTGLFVCLWEWERMICLNRKFFQAAKIDQTQGLSNPTARWGSVSPDCLLGPGLGSIGTELTWLPLPVRSVGSPALPGTGLSQSCSASVMAPSHLPPSAPQSPPRTSAQVGLLPETCLGYWKGPKQYPCDLSM